MIVPLRVRSIWVIFPKAAILKAVSAPVDLADRKVRRTGVTGPFLPFGSISHCRGAVRRTCHSLHAQNQGAVELMLCGKETPFALAAISATESSRARSARLSVAR